MKAWKIALVFFIGLSLYIGYFYYSNKSCLIDDLTEMNKHRGTPDPAGWALVQYPDYLAIMQVNVAVLMFTNLVMSLGVFVNANKMGDKVQGEEHEH